MKTNLFITTIAAGSLFLASCGTSTENVDLAASSVNWKGEVMGMYSHSGTLNLTEATLSMAGDKVAGGSFVADLSTISDR